MVLLFENELYDIADVGLDLVWGVCDDSLTTNRDIDYVASCDGDDCEAETRHGGQCDEFGGEKHDKSKAWRERAVERNRAGARAGVRSATERR